MKQPARIDTRTSLEKLSGLLDAGRQQFGGLLGAIPIVGQMEAIDRGVRAAGQGNMTGVAEAAADIIPAGRLATRGIKALTKGKSTGLLGDVMNIEAPRQKALDAAQRNAALPKSQGGLGLPPDNTPMQRAEAMGYSPAYHGTASDIRKLDPSMYGSATGASSAKKAFWAAESPRTAAGYAEYAATDAKVKRLIDQADKAEKKGDWDKYDQLLSEAEQLESSFRDNKLLGQNIMPLMIRSGDDVSKAQMNAEGAEFVDLEGGLDRFLSRAKNKDLAIIDNLSDDVSFSGNPTTHYAALNPSVVRSRFAAFDPMRADQPDLLAIQGGTGQGTDSTQLNRFETDADRRMAVAQRNAVEMLGLSPDNTAMDRAKAMGFDVEGYHGTGKVFDAMQTNRRGVNFTSPDPSFANKYAGAEFSVDIGESPNVIPTLARSGKVFDYENKDDVKRLAQNASLGKLAIDQVKKGDWQRLEDRTILESLKKLGYDGLYVNEQGVKNFASFDPSSIRSRFAAFDPARRNEADLLALQGSQSAINLPNFERLLGLLEDSQ